MGDTSLGIMSGGSLESKLKKKYTNLILSKKGILMTHLAQELPFVSPYVTMSILSLMLPLLPQPLKTI